MWVRLAAIVTVVVGIAGCAAEGIKLPTAAGPSQSDLDSYNRRNASAQYVPPSSVDGAVVATAMVPLDGGVRLIIIGNVMSLNRFDETVLNSRYDRYAERLRKSSQQPAFSRAWYLERSAGDVAVKISGIPGVYSRFYRAEVPRDLVDRINFASSFGTFMAGTSADLVAAEIFPKYGIWITRILCSEKSSDYTGCEAKYQRGLFQAADGREVDEQYQIKEVGATIDLSTYAKR
mgnify:CR=1 FL=1